MKTSPLLAAALLAGAGALVVPPAARGYDLLGFQLDLAHRDIRVWNTFSDPEANDNLSADPFFPGWFGADRAIWKGATEWASELHAGTGEGDPGQPFDLGSGGANFDFFFAGRNRADGEVGEDTHSELAGCAGGVHAFTEFYLNGQGFRTYYYACWDWIDGPELDWSPGTGRLDLQGIATHELGHALGLGHSADSLATMHATTSDGKSHRSLEADDIAGVQDIYGVRAAGKPRILTANVVAGILTLTGSGFADDGNEIWFTSGAEVADSDPVKVLDVPSTNHGTHLGVAIPAAAWSGEVVVRAGRSGSGERLTNAWPLDLDRCGPPRTYCTTTPNSAGAGALIAAQGSRSVSLNDFSLHAAGSVPNQFGLFFYAAGQAHNPVGNGILCLASPFHRLPVLKADALGRASFELNFESLSGAGTINAGSTWNFQWWYRDPAAGGATYNFSDAVEVGFCP